MRYVIFFLLLNLARASAQSQEAPWELRRDEDGIQLYTRPVAGNPVDEVKAVMVLYGSIDSAANGYFFIMEPAEGILAPVEGLVRENGYRIYVSLQRMAGSFELTYKLSISQTDAPTGIANKASINTTFDRVKLLRKLINPQMTAER